MSPTCRQLLAGLFGTVGVAAIPAVASTDTHVHPHSAGRYQETLDAEAQAAIDVFNSIEYVTFLAMVRNPITGQMESVFLYVENGHFRCHHIAPNGVDRAHTINFNPDLSLIPDWMAQPIGECLLEKGAES